MGAVFKKQSTRAVSVGAEIVEKGGKVSTVIIRQRVAFQHCMITGQTAAEFEPDGAAAREITQLLASLKPSKHESGNAGKPAPRRKVA